MMTMQELRDLVADNCDFSRPLRIVAHDVGKKAYKHSIVYVDDQHPVRLTVQPGMYDKRASIELAHYPDAEVLMPEAFVSALDELLEEEPRALVGWFYFFYFPMEYTTLFKRKMHIEEGMLDTDDIKQIYLMEDKPNLLIVEADYGLGSFD